MKCQLSYATDRLINKPTLQRQATIERMESLFGPAYHDTETGMTYWQFEDEQLALAEIIMGSEYYNKFCQVFKLCAENDEIFNLRD